MPPSPSRLRNLRYASFGFALLLLLAVGVATLWSLQRAAASFDWVEHTYRVIGSLQDYRGALRGAESAARGYRLSGSRSLRDEFTRQVPAIESQLVELSLLAADNPTQVARIGRLRQLTAQRLLLFRRLVEAAGSTPAVASGAELTSRIEAIVASMLATERSLGPCTASIGLATLPADGQSPAALLQQADAALYRAKAGGRNRVECVGPG